MPADFFGIEKEIQYILQNDPLLSEVVVTVESEPPNVSDAGKFVAIFVTRHEVPDNQPLAMGRIVRRLVYFSIWCYGIALDDVEAACKARDELVSKVENVLARNRSLNDKVDTSWPIGGRMDNAMIDNIGLLVGAEIELVAVLTTHED